MIFALFGVLITSIGIVPAFGENDSITVTTDKSSYSENEIISISGEITYLALGDQLTILITSPNGNIAEIDQVTAGPDKKFNTEITPNGVYWKIPGTYTILVTQDENNQATISFEFSGVVNSSTNELDEVIVEEPISIRLDGELIGTTMRTPGNDFELAVGFCFTEGLLQETQVKSIRYCGNSSALEAEFNDVTVDTDGLAPKPVARLGPASSSCGICGCLLYTSPSPRDS